ncbi:MAG: type III polyketide synthase [Candidatus Velthaea sp.]
MISSPDHSTPRLLALSTAVPGNVIDQGVAADAARAWFGERIAGYAALSRVFASTGIERRYSVEPLNWFDEPRDWSQRTAAYMAGATALFAEVTARALADAKLDASQIDTVVTVSSTGIATPSLEARVLPQLGFRPDVRRIPIFGLGCAGGVSGLAIASRIAAAEPGTTVLLVTIELCTLAFRRDRATKADLISTALFGDGAAAAILRCDAGRSIGTIAGATEHLWPDTLDIMGWSTDDAGLGVILSRSLPDFIAQNYRAVFDTALERLGIELADIDRVVCHPGGTKILTGIETALELPRETLAVERAVMRDFGNMSSPTVLFVLKRTLEAGFAGTAVLAALGPGFTAAFVALDVARA